MFQVFRPGHLQPTMSLEEFADREVEDAMKRQAKQKKMKMIQIVQVRCFKKVFSLHFTIDLYPQDFHMLFDADFIEKLI